MRKIMEHELTKEQIESLIFLGQLGTKYSKDEITELGIFPSNVLAPKVLPQWVISTKSITTMGSSKDKKD